MTFLRAILSGLIGVLGLILTACATPVPSAGDFQRPVPADYLGLKVDSDLLETSRLDTEDRRAARDLLKAYYSAEHSLREYVAALETNRDANEELERKYSVAEAITGGVAGLSSIGVIFATAAIAAPISGVVWIGTSQYIQNFDIEPKIKQADRQLADAQRILSLFTDVEKLFNGVAFAESYDEAHRRFNKWGAYVTDLEARTQKFFAKSGGGAPGAPPPGGSPSGTP
mgnify:CR=1 FL=1